VKAAFSALLQQIKDADDAIREKGIEFVKSQMQALAPVIEKNEDLQKHLANCIKKVVTHESGVTSEEFKVFLAMLTSLSIFKNDPDYPTQLNKIIVNQANLDKKFDASNQEHVELFISCVNIAQQLFARGGDSAPFLLYFGKHILPVIDSVSDKNRLALLKAMADTSRYTSLDSARAILEPVFETLKKQLPKQATASEKPKINFVCVECLLYMFHQLASRDPGFVRNICGIFIPTGQPTDFSATNIAEKKEDFLARLKFLKESLKSDDVKLIMSSLRSKLRITDKQDDKKVITEQLSQADLGQRSTINILTLVSNLEKKTPRFMGGDSSVKLSWKQSSTSPIRSTLGPSGSSGAIRGRGAAQPSAGRLAGRLAGQANANRKRKIDSALNNGSAANGTVATSGVVQTANTKSSKRTRQQLYVPPGRNKTEPVSLALNIPPNQSLSGSAATFSYSSGQSNQWRRNRPSRPRSSGGSAGGPRGPRGRSGQRNRPQSQGRGRLRKIRGRRP